MTKASTNNSEKDKKPLTKKPAETRRKLYRLPQEGKLAGVCAGLAKYLEVDVTLLRIIFVILAFASAGFWILVYVLMAIVMPTKRGNLAEGDGDLSNNIKDLASELEGGGAEQVRYYFGIGLIVFGIWLLLDQLFPELFSFNWATVWPALLVIFGVLVLMKARK